MDTSGRLFGYAFDVLDRAGEIAGPVLEKSLQRALELDLFGICRLRQLLACLDARAPQREHGRIPAIIEDEIGGAIGIVIGRPIEDAPDVIPVIGKALALHGKYRNVLRGYRGGGVILRRKNITRGPADFRAQRRQRFDQHGGLNRHMQRAGDARALERLCVTVFLARRHQTGHFRFSYLDLGPAIIRERNVLDDVVVEFGQSGPLLMKVKERHRSKRMAPSQRGL